MATENKIWRITEKIVLKSLGGLEIKLTKKKMAIRVLVSKKNGNTKKKSWIEGKKIKIIKRPKMAIVYKNSIRH